METESNQIVMSFHDLQVSGEHNNVSFSQVIQIMASEIKTREFKSSSPYPGFQHFDESDSQRFFGRGQVVSDLLRTLIKNVFMVVAGGSGSGKSSVVRAGLIPALSEQLPKEQFRRFIWTPDVKPFRGLYISLVSHGHIPQAEAEIAEPHEPSRSTLVDAITKLAHPGEQWLLFIDRFEELFTITPEQERVPFMDALVHLLKNPPAEVGLKVVVAMRSDYLDRIGYFPEFAQLVRRNLRMITSLHPDELRQIIERPAAAHGVVFEEGLVDEILKDIKGQPGALPLLQYTLNKLWEAELTSKGLEDRTINLKTYQDLGGIRGALAKRADSVFAELTEVEKSDARYIFLRLVDVVWRDQAMSAVPQRVPRHLFHTRLTPLIDKLTQSELLIGRQEGRTGIMSGSVKTMLGGKATLEIAHEIILSAWPQLKGWIQERQKALFMHGRVAERTAAWLDARQNDALHANDELLTGRELTLAKDMRARGDFAITVEGKVEDGLNEAENRFLDASLERRAERRMRRYINFVIRLAVIGIGLMVGMGLLDVWLRFGLLRAICK